MLNCCSVDPDLGSSHRKLWSRRHDLLKPCSSRLREIDMNIPVAIASAEAEAVRLWTARFVRSCLARLEEAIACLETGPVTKDCKAV
jgi:hypothetical protein